MATDLMLDQLTNDLVATPSNDAQLISGVALVEQRIRIRLKVPLASWPIDPTLGSRMYGLLRLSPAMAISQLPLVVKEALAPMTDIRVDDVEAWQDEQTTKVVRFSITYAVVGTDGVASDQLQFTDAVEVAQ